MLVAACSLDGEASDPAASPDRETTGSTASSTTAPEPESEDESPSSEPDDEQQGESGGGGDGEFGPEAVRDVLSELDGQLAIGNGPVVAVARPDGQRYIELDGGRTNLTSQPTWSPDGTMLIWSSISGVAQEARVQRFDDEGVADGDPLSTNLPGHPAFYFQWSHDAGEVLYLRNSTRRQTVEAGVLVPGGPARRMADGDPFFVAWAPAEPVIAAHVGDERVAIFDPSGAAEFGVPGEESEPEAEPDPGLGDPVVGDDVIDGGGFSAPAWLDDETLVAVVSEVLSAVDVESGVTQPLTSVDGPIQFVLSPDRSRIAFQVTTAVVDDGGILEVGATPIQEEVDSLSLVVLNVEDRSVEVVTDRQVLAWEWSPDSTKLAWLELDGPVNRRLARWRFWSANGAVGGDTRSPTLQLSVKEMVNYLPFFAQYSFSLRRWSPDSSAFAMVGSIRGRSGVWIHLVDVPADPVLVVPGDIVSWGSGPTPAPDAGRSPA